MNISSFVLEQALKRLQISPQALHQLQIAGKLSDVDGKGFPPELFQLSAPMVTRGLLNFAVLQMKPDWVYPFWVNQQLHPESDSFVARSQNPLLLNITHRNWTMLGSPHGKYEAIVDPCGLVTPLPREWSVDVWLVSHRGLFLPSRTKPTKQIYDTFAPRITTYFDLEDFSLEIDAFVGATSKGTDVCFQASHIKNKTKNSQAAVLYIAVRPFNPEGVSPIHQVELKDRRTLYVDKCLGIIFAEPPQRFYCSNASDGDTVNILRKQMESNTWIVPSFPDKKTGSNCQQGLANALAGYPVFLEPEEVKSIYMSIALGRKQDLLKIKPKSTWHISFDKRKDKHRELWANERSIGARILLSDEHLQKIFDANVLALLQLHDDSFISPGPFLYHHFWFRDAAPMLHALTRLSFHKRVRQVIDMFPKKQTSDGFFRGPDGEWDSNGAALWLIEQYVNLTHAYSWLNQVFPAFQRAANWILQKRRMSKETQTTHIGLLPPSLSAEHFGTVDQYYWDSFWGLAGIRSAIRLARALKKETIASQWEREERAFTNDIRRSLAVVYRRLGKELIPASPSRTFDESAIGFVAGIYPLSIQDVNPIAFRNTLDTFTKCFVHEKGYYHPIVHSGYNAYLTLQLAHAYLKEHDPFRAWAIADTIFHRCGSPYSLPEAIHPKTGGGAMGDGHHGWAAAESVLFLLDCLIQEQGETLYIFKNIQTSMLSWGVESYLQNISTTYGAIDCSLKYETATKALCAFSLKLLSEKRPKTIEITFPFKLHRVLPVSPHLEIGVQYNSRDTIVKLDSSNAVLLLEQ